MASVISKTTTAGGSILRRGALLRRHRDLPTPLSSTSSSPSPSSFSSVCVDSNRTLSDEARQDQGSNDNICIEQDKSRVRTIRLYRMILRQCQSLAPATADHRTTMTSSEQGASQNFMLQPRVVTTCNSLYFRTSPKPATEPFDLFRLFYVLVERGNRKKMPVSSSCFVPPGNSHEVDNKRKYSSVSKVVAAAAARRPPDPSSIDDWFYQVTGGVVPAFRNPGVDDDDLRNLLANTCWTSSEQLRSVVKAAFRVKYDRVDARDLHKWTIRAIQILQDQRGLWWSSSVAVTDRVRTIATCQGGRCLSALAKLKTRPSRRFTYKVRIENTTQDHLQLMGRSLCIQGIGEDDKAYMDPVMDTKMLDRPYVPSTVLRPGQVFEFLGNVNLKTDKGLLKGCFHMNRVIANSSKAGTEAMPIGDMIHVDVAPLELTM